MTKGDEIYDATVKERPGNRPPKARGANARAMESNLRLFARDCSKRLADVIKVRRVTRSRQVRGNFRAKRLENPRFERKTRSYENQKPDLPNPCLDSVGGPLAGAPRFGPGNGFPLSRRAQ